MEQRPLTESLRETLAVFEGATEPRTTPEVAERLDVGRRTAYARLERLVERTWDELRIDAISGRRSSE